MRVPESPRDRHCGPRFNGAPPAPSLHLRSLTGKGVCRTVALIGGLALPLAAGAETATPAFSALGLTPLVPVAQISAGDTAWLIVASALVLLMTLPGLALFYAGMVRRKNVLATMAQVLAIAAVVTLLWFAVGYSLAFMPGTPWVGGTTAAWLSSVQFFKETGLVSVHPLAPTVPEAVFVMFQLAFAIITPALVVGAFAERMRFSALLWFVALWSLVVYAPVAHWVWAPDGWLAKMGVLDFAGGTVVHVNAGVAGLVAAWMVGRREGWGKVPLAPANLAFTMVGASLLWVGWLGFNGGSSGAADARGAMAILATQVAAAAGVMGWMTAEWLVRGRPTLLGMSSGVVAGLVAVTPASGFVGPESAALIGALAGVGCFWGATGLKAWLRADDSLDVFGVHGVGGAIGALATGLLADPRIGGASGSVAVQALSVLATAAWSAVGTAIVLALTHALLSLRVRPDEESSGLDASQHGERLA